VTLSDAGVLNVCAGDWYATLDIDADVAVVGVAGADATTFHAEASGPALTVDTAGLAVSVTGVTLTGGTGGDASSILRYFSNVGGGVLCMADSDLGIYDAIVTGNSAAYGGGLGVFGGCYVELSGATVDFNEATDAVGGGLYVYESDAGIYDSAINYNTAENNNGGATIASGDVVIEGSEFIGNSSPNQSGGALFLYQTGVASITDTLFEDNYAGNDGGAVWVHTAEATFSGAMFLNNEADDSGGGIATDNDSAISLEDCVFDGNTADDGGGIFLSPVSNTASLTTVLFQSNSPDDIYYSGSYTYGATVSVACSSNSCL